MAQRDVRFDITAKDKTKKAFGSVNRGLSSMKKAAAPAVGQLARIGSVAATAAVGATAALVKMRMAAVDNLAKTADKLGVTTEALAGFRHAAELSGMSSQQFDKSLQNMGVQIANAAKGTGLAVRALGDLGLDAAALAELPLDQQMYEVAKAMEGVESQSEKTRIAYELFGARGVGVLNMMKGGADGMMAMAKEAETLGIAISRVDAAKIEEANDSVTRAKGVFEGFGNQIAVAFSPIVSELAANFYQTALDMNGAGSVGDRVVQALVKGFGFAANAVKGLKIAVMAVQYVFAKMAQGATFALSKVLIMLDKMVDAYNKVADVFNLEKIDFKPAEQLGMLSDAFGATAEEIKGKIQTALNEPLPSDQITSFYDTVQAKARETAEVVAANAPAVVMQKAETENVDPAKVSMYDKAKREGAAKLADFEKKTAAEKTQYVMGQLDAELSGVAKHSKKLFALQKAMQIGQAIMNTYTAATKALASYPPPLNAVFAGLAIANGMAQVAQIKAQSFEGGGFTGYGARAGGLDGKGGYMAMLHPNESVIDHTKGQGQGITIVNNVDATGGGADVDQRIRMAMEVTSQQTVKQVQDLLRRQRMV